MSLVLYIAENLSIATAYWFIAAAILPHLAVAVTARLSVIAFFVLCGATHIHQAYEAGIGVYAVYWHDHAIHAPQSLAVWGFVLVLRDLEIKAKERRGA